MDKPVAYKGSSGYIFISYAHSDSEIVFPLIAELSKKYHVWYDEGIPYSEEWEAVIIKRIASASLFLFLASDNSVNSKMCANEIKTAKEKDIPIINVVLKNSKPSIIFNLSSLINTFYLEHYDSLELFIDALDKVKGIEKTYAKKNVSLDKYIFKTKYVNSVEEYLTAVRSGYCVIEIPEYYLEELKVSLFNYQEESDDMLYEYARLFDFPDDSTEQENIFNYLIKKNHPKGFYGLANYYEDNRYEKDETIINLLLKAAELNYAPSCHDLYYWLDDYKIMLPYLEKAAELEYAEAEYHLGCLYFKGDKIPKDLTKALYWLNKAADQGYEYAKNELKKINGEQ